MNFKYKIDHISKTNNHKTVKIGVKSVTKHHFGHLRGPKKKQFSHYSKILIHHISKNKNWQTYSKFDSEHCAPF